MTYATAPAAAAATTGTALLMAEPPGLALCDAAAEPDAPEGAADTVLAAEVVALAGYAEPRGLISNGCEVA